MSNDRRFESIADLEDDYVLAVPKDAKPKDVIEDVAPTKSAIELLKYVQFNWYLKTVASVLQSHPTDKPADIEARYLKTLRNRLMRTREPLRIRNANFKNKYNDILVWNHERKLTCRIDVKSFGEATVNLEYIYKRAKVRVANEDEWILFQPSKHLREDAKIWTLIRLVGEDRFLKELNSNYRVLDGDFIEKLMGKVDLPFYLSEDESYLFAAPLEIHKEEHGPLKKLTAKQALRRLSIPALERVVEQGSAKL